MEERVFHRETPPEMTYLDTGTVHHVPEDENHSFQKQAHLSHYRLSLESCFNSTVPQWLESLHLQS